MSAWFNKDPLKEEFDKEEYTIPREPLNIPLILAEKQARKLFPRGIKIESENPQIKKVLNEFLNVNRINEQAITVEELCATWGQVIVTIDKYPGQIPRLGYADPYLLSRVEKVYIEEKSATVYKYVKRDAVMSPVIETWTEKTVKRIWFKNQKEVETGYGVRYMVEEWKNLPIDKVEEVPHNLGCLPVVEFRNKQRWIPPLIDVWSWKPYLSTWYPVKGLIKLAYYLLKQLWKNIETAKPRIVGNIDAEDMAAMEKMSPFWQEMIMKVRNIGGDGAKGSDLTILQGNMNAEEIYNCYKEVEDNILRSVGFSANNESSAQKTNSEIMANQSLSNETVSLLLPLRVDYWTRILDKVAIIERLWDGKSDRPFSLSIPKEENMNKSLELEEALLRIQNNLSNPVKELARMDNISVAEAEIELKNNIVLNKLYGVKNEEDKDNNKEDKKGKE